MSQSYKSFQTFVTESPIIKVGDFVDSRGKQLKVTPDMVRDIYSQINREVPILDSHSGNKIGTVKKFVLSDDGTCIKHKGFITDPERFSSRIDNGFHNISPELEVDYDETNKSVFARLDAIALTNNPGMIPDMVNVLTHHFEAPEGQGVSTENKGGNSDWKEPIGELGKQLENLNQKITELGEKIMPDEPQTGTAATNQPAPQMITMSADDLANLIKSAVQEQVSTLIPKQDPPKVETPPAVTGNDATQPQQPAIPKEFEEKFAKVTASYEKMLKDQYNTKIAELKSLGVDTPEKLVADSGFSLEQKISVLDSMKETFAKKTPMGSPMQEPISGGTPASQQKDPSKVSYVDVLKYLKADTPEMREKLRKTNLYDEDGYFKFM